MKIDYMVRQRAYNLFLEGKGYKFAAKELDINEHTARDWFRRFRAGPNAFESLLTDTVTTHRYPKEIHDKAIALRNDGMSWTDIMRITRVPVATLKNWLRREKAVN